MTNKEKKAAIEARTAAIKAEQQKNAFIPLFDHCAIDIDDEDVDFRLQEAQKI